MPKIKLLLFLFLFASVSCMIGRAQAFSEKERYKARMQIAKKEYDAALVSYDALIQANPHDTQAYLFRAYVYLHKKDTLRALTDYHKAAEIAPNGRLRVMAHHNIGYVRQQQARQAKEIVVKQRYLKQAIGHYQTALRQMPNDETTRYNLVACQHELKRCQSSSNFADNKTSPKSSPSALSKQRQQQEILQRAKTAEQQVRKKLARQRVKIEVRGNNW